MLQTARKISVAKFRAGKVSMRMKEDLVKAARATADQVVHLYYELQPASQPEASKQTKHRDLKAVVGGSCVSERVHWCYQMEL